MELNQKSLKSRLVGALTFGVFLNVSLITVLAYMLHIREFGKDGPERFFNELLIHPIHYFNVVIKGETQSNEIYETLHMVYTDLPIQGFFWLMFTSFVYLSFMKKSTFQRRDASEYGSHGSARWATDKEIKPLQKDLEGFIMGEVKGKPVVHSLTSKLNDNICAFGGSGSGKSAGFSVVNILHNCTNIGESMVITDPKGELYNKTVPSLRECGYEVLTFNLLDPAKSHRYNPLDYIETVEEAMGLSEMIIANSGGHSSDPMWSNAELAFFSALTMYLKETRPKEEHHIKSVLKFGTSIGSDEEKLEKIFKQLPEDSEARGLYNIFRNAEGKTRAGILIGFGVRLKLWVSNKICDLTSTSDFDINQLGKKKTALFLMIPDSETTYDLIPALVIDQMFNQLYKQAGRNESLELDIKVRCILDELANIAAIGSFERKVSTMRSRGISVVPIFQSITQFKNRYDHDKWSEILSSMDTIVFLGTNDKQTSKYFSEKLGPTTLMINSMSESENKSGGSSSKSYTLVRRDLMTPDELERMEDDQVIIFQRGKNPIKIHKHMYFKQKKWSNLIQTNWSDDIPTRERAPIPSFDPNSIIIWDELSDDDEIKGEDDLPLSTSDNQDEEHTQKKEHNQEENSEGKTEEDNSEENYIDFLMEDAEDTEEHIL